LRAYDHVANADDGGDHLEHAPQLSDPVGPPPIQIAAPPYFCYYGTEDRQIPATADHVNLIWISPWKGREGQITQLQAAKTHGLGCILDLSWVLFRGSNLAPQAFNDLAQYFRDLRQAGLSEVVAALYPVDEPDINVDGSVDVGQVNTRIRALWQEHGDGARHVPIAAIYGDHGFPGIETYDLVGMDRYSAGPQYPPVGDGQRIMLIAGGADPWREDPAVYEQALRADPRVVAVVAFCYFDFGPFEGSMRAGIKRNGMLPAYQAVGRRIIQR
jgi:hypothetical protein